MLGESLHDLVGAPKEELIHHLVADRPELRLGAVRGERVADSRLHAALDLHSLGGHVALTMSGRDLKWARNSLGRHTFMPSSASIHC